MAPAVALRSHPTLTSRRSRPGPARTGAARALLAALLPWFVAACGPATPEAAAPDPSAATVTTSSPAATDAAATSSPSTSPSSPATGEPAAAAAAPKPGVPYDSVPSPGTNPLSGDEAKELQAKCKRFSDAIAAAARKAGPGKRPIDKVFEALADPPKVAGVDVPRCAELMRRDTIDYFARTRENEAKINLRRVMVGLMSALDQSAPAFCASAPAVPASIEAVKDQPYTSAPDDWKAEGWRCARFDLSGAPQVFQYEMRTDAKNKAYEVIARGYPVQGGPPTELFITGKVESGAIDPSTPILRR